MKFLFLLVFFYSGSTWANYNYCGKVTSAEYKTAVFDNIRVGLVNTDRRPPFINVNDPETVTTVIRIVTNDPIYEHNSELDDISWRYIESGDRYFACVETEELKASPTPEGNRYFIDKVTKLRMWMNGEPILE